MYKYIFICVYTYIYRCIYIYIYIFFQVQTCQEELTIEAVGSILFGLKGIYDI
jgi:hypothetical protein